MLHKLIAWSCNALAALLLLLALLTLLAMLRALTVSSTLAAVESAFGSFVLCILLLLAARWCRNVGKARLARSGHEP